jgi:hypothetical protein
MTDLSNQLQLPPDPEPGEATSPQNTTWEEAWTTAAQQAQFVQDHVPTEVTEGTSEAVNGLPAWARATLYWIFTPVGAAAGGIVAAGVDSFPKLTISIAGVVGTVSASILGSIALSNLTRKKTRS